MSHTNTITVTKRDGSTKSVESPYTNMEAIIRLDNLCFSGSMPLNRNSFAVSLANGASQGNGLTQKQLAWVHIIVVEHEAPRRQPEAAGHLLQIRSMIDKAAETLKYPKVNLVTSCGQKVRLQRAGDASRTPGVIGITDGRPFGNNTYFGRIDLDGTLRPSAKMTEAVKNLLVAINEDPAATAHAHGQRTGSCCFCARGLTTGESVAVGYGPICANKFGLPWGEDRVSSTVEVSAAELEDAEVRAARMGVL